jgi:hypothetical protein
MVLHGTKCQYYSNKVPTCSAFVLGFGVVKLLITLNSFDWLRAHSVPNSIIMVHQPSTNSGSQTLLNNFHSTLKGFSTQGKNTGVIP